MAMLPAEFSDLEPQSDWCLEWERERYAKRLASTMDEMQAFYDAAFPRLEAAMASNAPLLYADIPGNVCFDYEYGNEAVVKDAFSRAAHVTRLSLDSTRVVGNPMEPKAALAAYDAASETYDLYSPTQGISLILGGLSAITGAPSKLSTPSITAVAPSRWTCAPMRFNSATCM